MSERYDFLIAGSNVAALTAAVALSRKGHRVAVIRSRALWGGHFAPTVLGGETFDSGMNLFEFDSFRPDSTDLLSYNSRLRSDVGRFAGVVKRFLENYDRFIPVETPKMFLRGAWSEDIYISNRLEPLHNLPTSQIRLIQEELQKCMGARSPLHASCKNKDQDLFIKKNYSEASEVNHGPTFHRSFIEPWLSKLSILGSSIPALFHRAAWAPLYYPETLAQAASGHAQPIGQTTFHYSSSGFFSHFIGGMANELAGRKNAVLVDAEIKSLSLRPSVAAELVGGGKIEARVLVWCGDSRLLWSLAGFPERRPLKSRRMSVKLFFCTVQTERLLKNFSSVSVPDESVSFYRATNQSFCAGAGGSVRLVVESAAPDTQVSEVAKGFLKMGVIAREEDLSLRGSADIAATLPSAEAYDDFVEMANSLEKEKTVRCLGPSAGYLATSLNDQIVQGLKIAEEEG